MYARCTIRLWNCSALRYHGCSWRIRIGHRWSLQTADRIFFFGYRKNYRHLPHIRWGGSSPARVTPKAPPATGPVYLYYCCPIKTLCTRQTYTVYKEHVYFEDGEKFILLMFAVSTDRPADGLIENESDRRWTVTVCSVDRTITWPGFSRRRTVRIFCVFFLPPLHSTL